MVEGRTSSVEETLKRGKGIAQILKPGDIIFLEGELGAGKTQLVKGVGKGLGILEEITSPTFVILKYYYGRIPLYHFDLYRLSSLEDLEDLEWQEIFYEGDGVVLIEWGSKIPQIFPEEYLQINIEIVGPSERRWIFYPKGNKYMEKVNEIERIWKE